jgi:hypothetical protein
MTEPVKEIKRGYVKWTDENGFHKEPLVDHPELLKAVSEKEQLKAEEVARLNESAEEFQANSEKTAEADYAEALEVLKTSDALTAAEAYAEIDQAEAPVAAPAEPVTEDPKRTTLTVSDERSANNNNDRNGDFVPE